MFARIKANSKNNVYLQVVFNTLKDPSAAHDEKGLLSALLNKYIEGCKNTLSYRYNKEHAEACLAILADSKKTIVEAINYLNTIPKLNQNGDFIQLLNTFFSIYPRHINACGDTIRNILSIEDLWQKPIEEWFKNYIAEQCKKPIDNHHDLLPQLSECVPAPQADKYADFLLRQLTYKEADEIDKGWIYAALGALLKTNRLSPAAQKAVTAALLTHFKSFEKTELDLSLIGLCEALRATTQDQLQTREIADRLFAHITRMLPTSYGFLNDKAISARARYFQKAFTTLRNFGEHYNEITRNGIVQFMLQPDNIYFMRQGILTLESWISDTAKEELLCTIERNQHFHELAPLFWHWVKYDTNHHDHDWTRKNCLEAHLNDARRALQNPTPTTPIAAHIQLLNADHSTRPAVKTHIITKLVDAFADQNRINHPSDNFRIALIQSFQLMIPWYSGNTASNIAKILSSASRNKDYPDGVRTQMACVAASMAEHLQGDDQDRLRHTLLEKLASADSEAIISALTEYARTTHHKHTPEIMAHLRVSNDFRAKLLLVQLHNSYRQAMQPDVALSEKCSAK